MELSNNVPLYQNVDSDMDKLVHVLKMCKQNPNIDSLRTYFHGLIQNQDIRTIYSYDPLLQFLMKLDDIPTFTNAIGDFGFKPIAKWLDEIFPVSIIYIYIIIY